MGRKLLFDYKLLPIFNFALKLKPQKYKKSYKKISINEIEYMMKEFGIEKGDTLLVHSSFKHISEDAENVIDFLKDFIGEEGNIIMPTHPQLKKFQKGLIYDVEVSPSTVGYLTEVFRKSDGVKRSSHPISSVACWGKDKEYLIKDNTKGSAPLPHGINSGYYKMTKLNAKALFIGVTAKKRGTIRHVAEEVLDENYPIQGLFNNQYIYVKCNSDLIKQQVRSLDVSKSQVYVAKSKIERDWLVNGIIKKKQIRGIPFELMYTRKCVDFMLKEAERENTSYPCAQKKGRF